MLAANRITLFLFSILCLSAVSQVQARQEEPKVRCASVEVQAAAFKRNPALKTKFESAAKKMKQDTDARISQPNARVEGTTYYIPIVFHIVLTNPNLVTDAQIQAQLDTLNKDYAGLNGDSVKIPAAFKSLYAKGNIQFKMATRTPDDVATTGITRTVAGKSSYAYTDNSVKYTALGGKDNWDPTRYVNVWLTNISGGILGYATFPGSSVAAEQGIVVLYSSLPGGTATRYNKGRTLSHEMGHYFFLYHIWGDDGGACSGSDDVGDTPNQADQTAGCPTGIQLDNCSSASPGFMYENFMDYTDDACMVMFTKQQATRMETALLTNRAALLNSNGADPIVTVPVNAALRSINTPASRICSPSFTPAVTFRNQGIATLTTVNFYTSIDNGTPALTKWTGSLATNASVDFSLNAITVTEGIHTLKIYAADPNNTIDGEMSNDTLTQTLQYYAAVNPPLTESFESSTFPPQAWDIVNPDGYLTWERITGIAKTGNASVRIRNLDYAQNGPKDYLRLPQVTIPNVDSAFMTFQVAAATSTNVTSTGNAWDTLQVLVSTDCGKTYTSLYKKWGSTLVTRKAATTTSFVPTSSEWRKDSINLTSYVGMGPIIVAFLNSSEFENNIYLDDINLYTLSISANLKERGFLVTPSPTTGNISVQFFPNPANLRSISIYDISGRKVAEQMVGSGNFSTRYDFDLTRFASGIYSVRAYFTDKTLVKKVLKTNL